MFLVIFSTNPMNPIAKAWYILFHCAIDLHYYPKTIQNPSISHTGVLGDMFHVPHWHCSEF